MEKVEIAKKMKHKAKIVIIRHGSTKLNSEDKIRGWMDLPLDSKGKKEAKEMGRKIKSEHLDGLVTSDLLRTQQTAEIVSKETGVPILEVSKDFRPWNVGDNTGQPNKDVMPILEDYAKNRPDVAMSKGESFNTFKDRFLGGVEKIQREYPDKKIGIVTHHRGDRIMAAWEAEGCPKSHKVELKLFLRKGIEPGDYRDEGDLQKREMAVKMK